jgi:hypothetical protein
MLWALVFLTLLVAAGLRMRPRLVIALEGGRARAVRGRVPGVVLADLEVVAQLTPGVSGRVELSGHGSGLRVRTPGLPEGVGQRARNVVHLRRRELEPALR